MKKPIKFCKMHALGNDFVVIDTISQPFSLAEFPLPKLSNRHQGIGFDQLLLIEKSDKADFLCRIFNADGSEAEQCGNGLRCIARYIREHKLSDKSDFTIQTKAGIAKISLQDFEKIEVDMGVPRLHGAQKIFLENSPIDLSLVSMGNPHAIVQVPSLKNFPVTQVGANISTHSVFAKGANVGFMEIVDRKHIRLRTYERGTGETLACGSNSCAAVVAGITHSLLDHEVRVELTLGDLLIEWQGQQSPVIMKGPAEKVFYGEL